MPDPKPNERRFFLCTNEVVRYQHLHMYPHSHIIGELFHVTYEGQLVTACFYYITPVSASTVPPLRPELGPRMIEADVPCRFAGCRKVARWKMSKAARRVLYDDHKETDEYIERKESLYNKN